MPEPHPIVFLLDDEPAVVVALARMLQSSGFTVSPYTSAAEFLEAHDAETPGCLVADVRMPGMSGLELQRTLLARGDACPPCAWLTRGLTRAPLQPSGSFT
jgi:FixJ family two-component response regulator